MAIIETEGLVLKTYNLSDADKIVIFLTEKEGLIRGVAKGAKRLKSKFGGSLEPFSIVNLAFNKKDERELVAITEIELIESFFDHTSYIEFLQKFAYFAEILIEFAPPHDPNERLYNMSKICFQTASNYPDYLEIIGLYFEVWVLKLGGYLPVWEKCISCKRIFTDTESVNLQADFHLICSRCSSGRSGLHIIPKHRKLYTDAQKISPQKFITLSVEKIAEIPEVSILLRKIMSQVLGRELSNKKILTAIPK